MRPRFLVLGILLAGSLFAVKPVSRILYRISHPLAFLELADAVGRGDNAIIAFMLDQDVPVDDPAYLEIAASKGHLSTVKLLLARGAPVNAPGRGGWTALHVAASRGRIKVIKRLLAAGADPALRTSDGATPATLARRAKHLEVARLLETLDCKN